MTQPYSTKFQSLSELENIQEKWSTDVFPASLQVTLQKSRRHTSSWWDCLLAVISCGLGLSMITMPFILARTGWLQGLAMMVIVALLNGLSLCFLAICSETLKVGSYFQVAKLTCGKPGEYLLAASMFALLMCPITSHLSVIVEYITPILFPDPESSPSKVYQRKLWTTAFCSLLLFPLCLIQSQRHLRNSSFVTFLGMVAACTIIAVSLAYDKANPEWIQPIIEPKVDGFLIQGFSTLSASFVCHPQYIEIVSMMQKPTTSKKITLAGISTMVILLVNGMVGIMGYLHYGSQVHQNVLSSEMTKLYIKVGTIGLALVSMFSYPLMMIPARTCILWLLKEWHQLRRKESKKEKEMQSSAFTFRWVSAFILLVACFFNVTLTGIEQIYALFGALGGSLVIYILPSYFFLRHHTLPTSRIYSLLLKFGAFINLVSGIFLLYVGIGYLFIIND